MAVAEAEAEAVAVAVAEAVAVAVAVLFPVCTTHIFPVYTIRIKIVSKVGVSCEASLKKSKKHNARAPSRPKMTTLTMKTPFLEQSRVFRWSSWSCGIDFTGGCSGPPSTRAGGQDDGS